MKLASLYISQQPHFDLEPHYIIRKLIKQIPMIVRTEILSTFHTRVEYNLGKQDVILPIQTNGGANAENARNNPFLLKHIGPHLIHQCLGPPHSPPETASGSNQPFCHSTLCEHTHTHTQIVQTNVP